MGGIIGLCVWILIIFAFFFLLIYGVGSGINNAGKNKEWKNADVVASVAVAAVIILAVIVLLHFFPMR